MSPKLADEARVIRLASTMTRTPVLTLQKLETGNGPAILREAAGWVFAADLGPTHGQWSVLMEINLPAFTGKAAPNSPSLEKTKFGRLTVMGRAPNVRPKFSAWHCLCQASRNV